MWITIKRFLKNKDAFGHQVNLTVKNGNGIEQTSVCSGVATMLVYSFISVYAIMKSIKMFQGNLDNFTSSEEIIDFHNV